MLDKKYDFAGWVTKADILCSDGVVIKHDAFAANDQTTVPLVWEHQHNAPQNVLGHVILHNKGQGVYGYGYFNDTPEAQSAKELIKHGDISAMSIFANKLKKRGQDVMHGIIREVSLVLAGANPGALIEEVISHADGEDGEAIIFTGNLIHSADDVIDEGGNEVEGLEDTLIHEDSDRTVGDVLATLNDEQQDAVAVLLAGAMEGNTEEIAQSQTTKTDELGDNTVKHNVFNQSQTQEQEETLSHSDLNTVISTAMANNTSFKKELELAHGITNIETLFPEAHLMDAAPRMIYDNNTAYEYIMSKVSKSPFSRIKTRTADFTEAEARARGYIKGKEKIEQIFSISHRETTPQTIYKKQKLDRDDVIDITDFDVVAYVNREMRIMLDMELARAIFVGDGREVSDESKIQEDKVRPIVTDDDFYTIKKEIATSADLVEAFIKGKIEYQGSGGADLFIDPMTYADLKLVKATDGRYLYETDTALKARMGVNNIVETTFLQAEKAPKAVYVNLADYTVGASKGGQVTTFDDFDIDFNQYKYLIETRICGALTVPKSAITFSLPASKM